MSTQQLIAVLDIGSTTVRYAVGRADGTFVTPVHTQPTRAEALETQVVGAVSELREACPTLARISVSTTGLVDVDQKRIVEFDAADGAAHRVVELGRTLSDEFGVPTHIENDCNMAVLGERVFGDGRGYEAVVHLTMATGIGAGVYMHGSLMRGETGKAAEVGHFPVGGPDCTTSMGVSDSWEAYCSGRGVPTFVSELLSGEERETSLRDPDQITAKVLFDEAAAGDAVAVDYLDRIHRFNAAGIGGVINAYDPGIVTIGGAVALNNPEVVLSGIEAHVDDFVYGERPEISLSSLREKIELYGALAYPEYASQRPESDTPTADTPLRTDGR